MQSEVWKNQNPASSKGTSRQCEMRYRLDLGHGSTGPSPLHPISFYRCCNGPAVQDTKKIQQRPLMST